MSSVRFALEKLNNAVEKLDHSLVAQEGGGMSDGDINVDFIAQRLDRAIHTVETLLKE
tara:strand:+ start:598 stop:771 length:174 start_codon:yes stop_codon:yes gene_type:complete